MTKQVQRRRGTATQHTSFTGAEGELSVNTTNKSVHVHDNVTAGGFEAARADMDNVTSSSILTAAGITATTAELNYVDGVTSAIQTQLDGKAGTASPTFTGTLTTANLTATGTTTLAGADISGTLTSDGLTVNGNATIQQDDALIFIKETDGTNIAAVGDLTGAGQGGAFYYDHGGTATIQLKSYEASTIENGLNVKGDISFYEDTGTTPKFFWDASAEYLGLGTTTPDTNLHVYHATRNNVAVFESGDADVSVYLRDGNSTSISAVGIGASTDDLTFRSGNSERMRINSSGNVGIGTSSPEGSLHLNGSFAGRGLVIDLATEGVTDNVGTFNAKHSAGVLAFQTNSTERMRITSSGSVGIGTSSPVAPLHVIDKSLVTGTAPQIRFNPNANDASDDDRLILGLATGSGQFVGGSVAGDSILRTTNGGNLLFGEGTTERMRIDSSGNVGIGTSSPSYTIHTKSSSGGVGLIESTSSNSDLYFKDSGTTYNYSNGIGSVGNALRFRSGDGTERMRIDSSGNLLVGTTATPSFAGLAVGSTSTGKSISVFSSANGSNGIIGVYQSNGTQEGQLYAGTGNVNFFGTSVVKVVASTNGVQLTSGATSWTAISDERAKDIIEPITNAVQKVSTLRSVIGKYKTDTEETRRSFLIAQDVQAVLPEAVDATDEDNLGVRYTETIPLLVAAIQEQQVTIQTLTARIAALES